MKKKEKKEEVKSTTAIRLRTLARKSVLDFGMYEGRSVQQVIDLKNVRTLRFYYYNCSMISFLPDILDEIGITEKWRIEKPGKDPEKGKKLDEWKDQNVRCYIGRLMDEDEKAAYKAGQKAYAVAKGEQNRKYREFKRKDSKTFSKGNMAWKNQGH